MYWTYTLFLLLRPQYVNVTDCINEGNLHKEADGKQMIPELLL
jgi:hypothetical protein